MYHDRAAWLCAFFVGKKKMEAKDIHKEMLPMYGEHCLSRQAVHNWVQKFSEGRTSIEDEHRAGRPVEIATPETLQRVEDIIRAERRVTVDAFFPLVWPKKHHLSGERFPDDDAVERAVRAWFRQEPKEFYAAGFQGLVKRWDKCLNLYGDYVEK